MDVSAVLCNAKFLEKLMSSLSYISEEYGSNSEDSDTDTIGHGITRPKLPTPDLSKVAVVPSDTHIDDPQIHGGRSRSFPHVRGNWATFVYVNWFAAVKVYCNEDKSRTFISLDVDPFSHKNLSNVSKKVDDVLTEFQLPTFYKEPSFHMSLLWTNGDKQSELDTIIDTLNDLLLQEIEKELRTVLIDTINCKSGNKYFQYSLI
ncbi:unnamed protein product [Spodoptera exigua]|nr:unnamed protein product [Spodoptera exigua]